MNVNALGTSGVQSAAQGTAPSSGAQDTDKMFLQLLMAQLKSQSPLDPVDPNQFVGQLVQFNTLDQLIEIRQLVQQAVSPDKTAQG